MSTLVETLAGTAEAGGHPLLVALSIFAPGAMHTVAADPEQDRADGRSTAAVAAHLGRLGLEDT